MFFRITTLTKLILIPGLGLLPLATHSIPVNCKPGTQLLLLKIQTEMDSLTHTGFQEHLVEGLKTSLAEVGYCLDTFSLWRQMEEYPNLDDAKILALKAGTRFTGDSGETAVSLTATVLMAKNANNAALSEAFSRPLLSLRYNANEPASMESITIKKVAENLKDRFICHLFIRSNPPSLNFRTQEGLNGVTPVEWVMPTGRLKIMVDEKGYLPFIQQIQLDAPGEHNFFIKLTKRRFYHSRLMIPAVAAAILGSTSYFLEQNNYEKYKNLDQSDLENQPESFRREFIKAKRWEKTKFGSFLAAGIFLTFSFWF